MQCLPLAHRSC
jgi:hypothetical protein